MAAQLEIRVTIIMPPEQKESLRYALDADGGLRYVSSCLSKIDVERAEASLKTDEDKVKKTITDSVGFKEVNRKVKKSMVQMALKECAEMLTTEPEAADDVPTSPISRPSPIPQGNIPISEPSNPLLDAITEASKQSIKPVKSNKKEKKTKKEKKSKGEEGIATPTDEATAPRLTKRQQQMVEMEEGFARRDNRQPEVENASVMPPPRSQHRALSAVASSPGALPPRAVRLSSMPGSPTSPTPLPNLKKMPLKR